MPTLIITSKESLSKTAVNCERDGHCWHGGTAVDSLYCCRCGQYLRREESYSEFVGRLKQEIDTHPEWGIKYF